MSTRKKSEAPGEGLGAVLDVEVVRTLAEILERHGLTEINISTPAVDLVLRRGAVATAVAAEGIALPAPIIAAAPALASLAPLSTVPVPMPPVPERASASASLPARPAASASAGETAEVAPNGQTSTVNSPFVGTFYRSPSPNASAFVEVGQRVKKGQVLCIVEAMKLMNEIESEVDGTVVACMVENAQPVEYGQPLFKVSLS